MREIPEDEDSMPGWILTCTTCVYMEIVGKPEDWKRNPRDSIPNQIVNH